MSTVQQFDSAYRQELGERTEYEYWLLEHYRTRLFRQTEAPNTTTAFRLDRRNPGGELIGRVQLSFVDSLSDEAVQDTLGRFLFRLCLYKSGEDVFDKSFIDIFNKLEKIGIISNYEKWDELRNLRNEIAHNYDTKPDLNITRINEIISLKDNLTSYFYSIKKYFNL